MSKTPVTPVGNDGIPCAVHRLCVETSQFTTFTEVFDDPNTATARKALQLEDNSDVFKVDEFFCVSIPLTSGHTFPVGRSTRCFTVYEPETGTILEDTSHVLSYARKDTMYVRLHEGQTADVVAAGDVPGEFHYCEDDDLRPSSRKHKYYHIILRQVGRRLCTFKSTHEFVTVILDAFIGFFPFRLRISLTVSSQLIEKPTNSEFYIATSHLATSSFTLGVGFSLTGTCLSMIRNMALEHLNAQ